MLGAGVELTQAKGCYAEGGWVDKNVNGVADEVLHGASAGSVVRANSNHTDAKRAEGVNVISEPNELRVAMVSPVSTIEHDDRGRRGEDVDATVNVLQGQRWKQVTNADGRS